MERNNILYVARTEASAGVKETGDNRGVRVEEYQRAVGLPAGAPWCSAFVAWCCMKGMNLPRAPRWCAGSTTAMFGNAFLNLTAKNGLSDYIAMPGQESKIKPGWIWVRADKAENVPLFFRGKGTKGHTGIVMTPFAPDRNHFTTTEGNTNEAGSREGDGVYNKVQDFRDKRTLGYFDPVALTISYLKDDQLNAFLERRSGAGRSTTG
jgi:hypothetical protein